MVSNTTPGAAVTATTEPVGATSVALLANSDTYVSVPFQRPAAFVGSVASVSGSTIALTGSPGWSTNQFVYAAGTQPNTYYVFIRSGAKEGNYYTVTANSGNTLTLDLAGDSLGSLAAGDSVSVVPYWTLGTVFPASDAGVSFSSSASPFSIQTSVLLPNLQGTGINLAASANYFFYNGAWRRVGQNLTLGKNDDILVPDSYFIVRNAANAGTLTAMGGVIAQRVATPFQTSASTRQDNAVALPRPIPVSLNDSGLIGSGAFAASSSPFSLADMVLVFDNATAAKNKAASATYFYFNNAWRKVGANLTQDFGATQVFGPTAGIIIRKSVSASGASSTWINSPTY